MGLQRNADAQSRGEDDLSPYRIRSSIGIGSRFRYTSQCVGYDERERSSRSERERFDDRKWHGQRVVAEFDCHPDSLVGIVGVGVPRWQRDRLVQLLGIGHVCHLSPVGGRIKRAEYHKRPSRCSFRTEPCRVRFRALLRYRDRHR